MWWLSKIHIGQQSAVHLLCLVFHWHFWVILSLKRGTIYCICFWMWNYIYIYTYTHNIEDLHRESVCLFVFVIVHDCFGWELTSFTIFTFVNSKFRYWALTPAFMDCETMLCWFLTLTWNCCLLMWCLSSVNVTTSVELWDSEICLLWQQVTAVLTNFHICSSTFKK